MYPYCFKLKCSYPICLFQLPLPSFPYTPHPCFFLNSWHLFLSLLLQTIREMQLYIHEFDVLFGLQGTVLHSPFHVSMAPSYLTFKKKTQRFYYLTDNSILGRQVYFPVILREKLSTLKLDETCYPSTAPCNRPVAVIIDCNVENQYLLSNGDFHVRQS